MDSTIDPDIFFDAWRATEAKAICDTCWFADQCRELGAGEEYGVWAGEAHEDYERKLHPDDLAKRDAQIVARKDAGESSKSIAELFGMSKSAVDRVIVKHRGTQTGIVVKPAEERAARDAGIVALRQAEGLSYDKIAARLDVTPAVVYRALQSAGLTTDNGTRPQVTERDAQIIELRRAGKPYRTIANELGVDQSAIYRALTRAGLVA